MRQLATDNVAKNLRITMRMCGEPRVGRHTVFIQDTKAAVIAIPRVEVVCKREGMVGIQPTMIGVASLRGRMCDDFRIG